jgi:hypothetical protein
MEGTKARTSHLGGGKGRNTTLEQSVLVTKCRNCKKRCRNCKKSGTPRTCSNHSHSSKSHVRTKTRERAASSVLRTPLRNTFHHCNRKICFLWLGG